MKSHTRPCFMAACATGLLVVMEGCWYPGDFTDVCRELSDGGALDCQNDEGKPCLLELNGCTYYRIGQAQE